MRDWSTSSLGERIRHLCLLRGVGQNDLAKRAGIKSGPMSRLATKRARAGGSVARIADAAPCSIWWLAIGRGQPDDACTPDVAEQVRAAVREEIARARPAP